MKKYGALLLVMLLLGGLLPSMDNRVLSETDSFSVLGRATGVDVSVSSIAFSYTTSSNAEKYQMFSSNSPIPGFDRPEMLYAVDAVIDVPIQVDITVENTGTAPSGNIDVEILVLHNEYSQFELVNQSVMMSSLNGGNSFTVSDTFTPTYSGNHTLVITATSAVLDDNSQNDQYNRAFTVANWYFNCDNLAGWTAGVQWGLNADTGLSMASSCHVGNGQYSSYTNNLATGLVTPVMDMSDAVESPTRTNGLSFFYTGSSQNNDVLKIQVKTAFGGWFDLGSVTGTIDQDFSDGRSFQTFSISNAGAASPLIPVPQEHFHSQTQFRFFFETDASETDIGFFLDEIVFVYDQKVRAEEFALSSSGISTTGSIPGQWGSVRVELTNDGNISDYFLPSVIGLPANWNVYYANPNGVSINSNTGILLTPGESRFIDIRVQPEQNATIGFHQMTFLATSSQHTTINSSLPMQFQVVPNREPFVVKPNILPLCPPGSSCPFNVEIQNIGGATDVFDLQVNTQSLPSGWDVNFAWTQDSKILVRPNSPEMVELVMTVPGDAAPDSKFSFELTASSENMSSRSHTEQIEISASMVSDAEIGMSLETSESSWLVNAGETISVEFTIWNNATRQDIFTISLDSSEFGLWDVEGIPSINAVINSQSSSTFTLDVTAPATAQAGDKGPELAPQILSIRSGMEFHSKVFDELLVSTVSDLELRLVDSPSKLYPGIPSLVLLQLENNGNGPVIADVLSQTIPQTWNWWMAVNDVNVTAPFSLSASYDALDIVEIQIWILLPSSERSGEVHSLSFTTVNSQGLEDINPSDNQINFDTITGSVRIPQIIPNISETSASVGGTQSVNVTVKNIGNAADNSFKVMATISVTPPNPELIAFMSVGNSGSSIELGVEHLFVMEAGQEMPVLVDVIIPESTPINTRIVVHFEILAGIDELMRPYELSHEILILVDERRAMDAVLSENQNIAHETGNAAPFWINLTSSSSAPETLLVTLDKPERWQTVCQGVLTNSSAQQIKFDVGHISEQNNDIFCELHRLGGPLDGILTVHVESSDGLLSWSDERTFTFTERDTDEFSMNVEIIASSFAAVLFLAILLTLGLMKRRRSGIEEFTEDDENTTVSGPPVQVSGPPITTSPAQTPRQDIITQVNTGVVQGPPEIPHEGLPPGWTIEQWNYYGQQYLESKQ